MLFRYAIAIFKYMETTLLKQCDYMSIYNTFRDGVEYLSDIQTLTQVSLKALVISLGRIEKQNRVIFQTMDIMSSMLF